MAAFECMAEVVEFIVDTEDGGCQYQELCNDCTVACRDFVLSAQVERREGEDDGRYKGGDGGSVFYFAKHRLEGNNNDRGQAWGHGRLFM